MTTIPLSPELDRTSFTPLYVQLRELLVQRLRRGDFAPGAPFLSEREMIAQYGVSSVTTRRVMTELVREGLIERRNGVGTFVRAEAPRRHLALLVLEFKEAPQVTHRMIASAFGELVGGVAQGAWDANAALGLAYVAQPEELGPWLVRAVAERSADGLLVRAAGDLTDEELAPLERSGLPFVLVKRHLPGHALACVVADERRAVQLGTEHLLALGHRAIGFVASTQSASLYEERAQGYADALAAAALPFDPQRVVTAPDFSPESGEEAVRELLQRPGLGRPTALMVASDSLAMGAYRALAAAGLRIPDDVSVASVDDIPEAQALQPPLTTARTSHLEFGIRATRLLLRLIDARWKGLPLPIQTDVIEPDLVVRSSTAAPPT